MPSASGANTFFLLSLLSRISFGKEAFSGIFSTAFHDSLLVLHIVFFPFASLTMLSPVPMLFLAVLTLMFDETLLGPHAEVRRNYLKLKLEKLQSVVSVCFHVF